MWGQVMLLAFLLITSNHSWEVLVLRWDMLLCCWWSLLSGAAIALGVRIWFATIFRWVVPVNNVHTGPRIQKFPAEYSIYEIQRDDQCYLLLLSVVLILWLIDETSPSTPAWNSLNKAKHCNCHDKVMTDCGVKTQIHNLSKMVWGFLKNSYMSLSDYIITDIWSWEKSFC